MFRGVDLTRTRNANLNAPVPTTLTVYSGTGVNGYTDLDDIHVSEVSGGVADPGLSAYKSLRKYGKVSI